MEIENLGAITKCSVDLFFRPDIECAFLGLCVAAVGAAATRGCRRLRRRRSRLPLMSCRGLHNQECRARLLRIVDLAPSGMRRDMRRQVAPHRRASFRNAAHASSGRPNNGETASDMIMHSARSHFAQRERSHFQRMFA